MPIQANVTETQIDVSVSGGVGPSGSAGAAATVAVGTVTTGAPGTSASVVNAGSSSAAVLNFTIPAGAAGQTGATGATGAQGPAGPTGAQGPAGTTTWAGITDKPSTFTPASHAHGNVTNDGRIGTAADKIVVTGAGGSLVTAEALPDACIQGNAGVFLAQLRDDGIVNALDSVGFVFNYHDHGNLSPGGLVNGNTASGQIVVTTTGGALTTAATIGASSVSGLATVATSGSYADLSNKPTIPSAYTLPTATASILGGVKIGSGISIDGSGVISASSAYTLPNATTSTLGGVIVGTGLGVASGTVSVSYGTSSGTACQGNDSRLSDTRTPTDGSVTDAKITSGGLSTSVLNWSAIAPWAASTAYSKGDLVSYLGIAYRRSVAGTSGATFNSANWQQITPSDFVGSQITSGTVAVARLGTGSPSSANYLRGDGAWTAAPVTSVDGSTGAVTVSKATIYEFTRSSAPSGATGGSGSWTWALPSGAKLIEFVAVGAGGGGGSGRRGATTEARYGGGGGAGGNGIVLNINAASVSGSLTVTIGAGGAGGASVTADSTTGNTGTQGGSSSVAWNGTTWLTAVGGLGGSGGSTTAGTGGQAGSPGARTYAGGTGNSASVAASGNATSPVAGFAGNGGGPGGSINASNTIFAPGGQSPVSQIGAMLGNYSSTASTVNAGAASTTGNATAGPDGATYAYGGQGGGAAVNAVGNSGAGGNGGDGYVRITVWS